MTNKERRTLRRHAIRAALGPVAAAKSFQALRKKRTRRSPMRRALIFSTLLAAFIAMMISAPKIAHAGGGLTPEIDPSSMAGAMTLLVGGVLALTDRSRHA